MFVIVIDLLLLSTFPLTIVIHWCLVPKWLSAFGFAVLLSPCRLCWKNWVKLIEVALQWANPAEERVDGWIERMTPKKTAVKGSYWFIFHGKRDVMNSKLREPRSKAVYQLCAAAQTGTLEVSTAASLNVPVGTFPQCLGTPCNHQVRLKL